MPTLTIDNRIVEVPKGTKVIDAAEKLGIMIPRFCYHPALGAVGACRVCAVTVLDGPRTGVQMSCQLAAEEGMLISTTDPAAVAMRRHVIEWLMLNHPHDCPVCDEGGHCLLQDLTVSGGHGRRRFPGEKRTHRDQYLGPLVVHEMNRCIQCYRCVRFYREYAGYSDLGVTGIGTRVYFGRFEDGTLESPFAGNLVDICPTGVFTDKPSRYAGRLWDYQRSPSVCIHCSLGCATTTSARYREVVRQEARYSKAVNGHFICDRGRYGTAYANLQQRPRTARVDGRTVAVADALKAVAARLNPMAEPDRRGVCCVGSSVSSIETLAAIRGLSGQMAWPMPGLAMPFKVLSRVRDAVSSLKEDGAVSLSQIAAADAVVVAGCDPVNEAPMLALALRQANRNGAQIFVIEPRPVKLPFDFVHFPVSKEAVPDVLSHLAAAVFHPDGKPASAEWDSSTVPEKAYDLFEKGFRKAAAALKKSKTPLVVCGTDAAAASLPFQAAEIVASLRASGLDAGLFYLLPGANAFGAMRVFDRPASMEEVIEAVENGDVRTLLLIESDPADACGEQRWNACRKKLDLLVVMDFRRTAAAEDADIFLPTQTIFESGGCFINQEGRIQKAFPAFDGGTPIRQTGNGGHPPRTFEKQIPGGEPVVAWRLLARLSGVLSHGGDEKEQEEQWLEKTLAALNLSLSDKELAGAAVRALLPSGSGEREERKRPKQASAAPVSSDARDLLLVEETFGTEPLSATAACLEEKALPPRAVISSADAEQMGLAEGETVTISSAEASVSLPVSLSDRMARKTVVVARSAGGNWRSLLGVDAVSVSVTGNQTTGEET